LLDAAAKVVLPPVDDHTGVPEIAQEHAYPVIHNASIKANRRAA
jgi:hypothetical protein